MSEKSVVNYRYAVDRKLGEGMSGEVFLVHDLLTDHSNIAMKILRTAEDSSRAEELFRGEISTLLNLHHPNLIRLFDFGTVRHSTDESYSSRRFFTMEFLNGADSLQWVEGIAGTKERDGLLLDLLSQALHVLAYVHQLGVIHCDIKPHNLIVMEEPGQEGIPILKMADFGLSGGTSDSPGAPLRGTPEYSAPELLRGEPFDHRIDLFALGCSFFHLIEARSPFEGADIVQIVKRVLGEEAPLSPPVTDEGRILHDVVARLMSKDRSARFASAFEAASFLLESGPSTPAVRKHHLLGKPRFVGRERERTTVRNAFDRLLVQEKGPSAVVICGEEGIGKSALLRELVCDARRKDLRVFEADNTSNPLPFNAVNRILRELESEARSVSDEGREIVKKFDTSLKQRNTKQNGSASHEAQRDQEMLTELKARFISSCGKLFPFVLAADNLESLDQQSVGVLKTVIRDLDPSRILVIAAESASASSVLDGSVFSPLPLQELEASDLAEMYASVFGSGPGAAIISQELFRLYGGTPAPIIEAFQSLTGLLTWKDLNNEERIREIAASLEKLLPSNLEEFLIGRLNSLKPEGRLVLEVLGRFTGPARIEILAELLPFHRKRIEHTLQHLESRELISSFENDRRYAIRSRKLQKALHPLDPLEERHLRSMIAASLALSEDQALVDLEELGYQFAEAGKPAEASLFYEKAADAAGLVAAYQHELSLSTKAGELADISEDPVRISQTKQRLVKAYFSCGNYTEAIACGRQVLNDHDPASEGRARLFKMIGCAESRLGNFEQARSDLGEALRLAADDLDRIELKQELAGIEINVGHFQDAEMTCLEQLGVAKAFERDSLVAAIYTDLGISTFLQGRYDEAITNFTESKSLYEAAEQPSGVANAMNNIANALSAKGEVEQAIGYWREALAMSEAHATLSRQAEIMNNLGIAHYNIRQYNEANRYYEEASSIFERIGSRSGVAYTLTNRGEVALAEVEYENALDLWNRALALYRDMGDAHGLCETHLQIAQVFLILGDTASARQHLASAGDGTGGKDLAAFPGVWEYQSGLMELANGNLEQAQTQLEAARPQFEQSAPDKVALCDIRIAECRYRAAKDESAIPTLHEIMKGGGPAGSNPCAGDAALLLATIARESRNQDLMTTIGYLREGFKAIAREPVKEVSWKIVYALGTELASRGQAHQATECFRQAGIVLNHILSKFRTDPLRDRYLDSDGRRSVLADIHKHIQSRGKNAGSR